MSYWNITKSAEDIVQKLQAIGNPVDRIEAEGRILVFYFPGSKGPLSYYGLNFLTDCHGLKMFDGSLYDGSFNRIIKCKTLEEAEVIAKVMLGEEVYSGECLSKIKSIALATQEKIRSASNKEYAMNKLAERLSEICGVRYVVIKGKDGGSMVVESNFIS